MCDPDYMRSREAYDAYVNAMPKESRWQWWPVPWKLATWSERLVKIMLWIVSAVVVSIGAMTLIGACAILIESYTMNLDQNDQCLKQATNGYEIRNCH